MQGYISRGLAYTSFIVAAAVAVSDPAPSIIGISSVSLSGLPTWLATIAPTAWAVLLIVASGACLLGVITRTWVGEYAGLTALMIALTTLGVAQLLSSFFVMAFLMFAAVGILWYRFYIVSSERAAALKQFRDLKQFKDSQQWKHNL